MFGFLVFNAKHIQALSTAIATVEQLYEGILRGVGVSKSVKRRGRLLCRGRGPLRYHLQSDITKHLHI